MPIKTIQYCRRSSLHKWTTAFKGLTNTEIHAKGQFTIQFTTLPEPCTSAKLNSLLKLKTASLTFRTVGNNN